MAIVDAAGNLVVEYKYCGTGAAFLTRLVIAYVMGLTDLNSVKKEANLFLGYMAAKPRLITDTKDMLIFYFDK